MESIFVGLVVVVALAIIAVALMVALGMGMTIMRGALIGLSSATEYGFVGVGIYALLWASLWPVMLILCYIAGERYPDG